MFLLKKPIVIIILILSLLGAIGGIYGAGYSHGHKNAFSDCQKEKAATIKAAEDINKKIRENKKGIKHETQSLDRQSIVNQLCANGWVRVKSDCPAE